MARNSRLHVPDRPRGLLEPCAATSGKHGSEEGSAGKRRSLSDYYLLEGAGLAVQLVNPAQARQLAGRPKTDRLDAQWIARLAEMGLLRPSFVPPPEIRALRDLTRTWVQLDRDRTREWQRLEKLLEGALGKLSSVVSPLARTKTARGILEATSPRRARPEGPGGPGRREGQGRGRRASRRRWTACGSASTTPC